MKHIIFEYHKAFNFIGVKIALLRQNKDYLMVVESDLPLTNEMEECFSIHQNELYNFYNRIISITDAQFFSVWTAFTTSILPIMQKYQPVGLDGDRLTITARHYDGYLLTASYWAPNYFEDDRYGTNEIYLTFMKLIEIAGLKEWYSK